MSATALYLVQHGLARPPAEGTEPELTADGRREVMRMASWASGAGVEIQHIRHSGKLRAVQTAELLADALDPPGGALAVSGLKPMDDVRPLAEALERDTGPVMLVGHLPHLARLVGLLLTGDVEAQPVGFRNAGLVCLACEERRWSLRWAVTPELVP